MRHHSKRKVFVDSPSNLNEESSGDIGEEDISSIDRSTFRFSLMRDRHMDFGPIRRCRLIGVILCYTLSSFQIGYFLTATNKLEWYMKDIFSKDDVLKHSWDSPLIIGLVSSLVPVGAIFGCISCTLLLSYSHRRLLLFSNTLIFLCIAIIFTKLLTFFLLSRIMAGFSVGIYSVLIPLFLKEIVPVELKGMGRAAHQSMIALGMLFSSSFKCLTYHKIWILIFCFPLLIIILQSILLCSPYNLDSPKYLLKRGKKDEARKSFANIYGQISRIEQEVAETVLELSEAIYDIKFVNLCSKRMRKALSIACCLAFLTAFTGATSILMYSYTFFSLNLGSDKSGNNLFLYTVYIHLSNFILSLFGIYAVYKVGRKVLLILGSFILCAFLFAISWIAGREGEVSTMIALCAVSVGAYELSYGPVMWVFLADLLPKNPLIMAIMTNWGAFAIVCFLTPLTLDYIQIHFYIYAGLMFLGFIFVISYIPETKGMLTREVRDIYDITRRTMDTQFLANF